MHPATECGVTYGRSPRPLLPTLQALKSPPFMTMQPFGVDVSVAAWATTPGTTTAPTTHAQTIARHAFIPALPTRCPWVPRSHDGMGPQAPLGGAPPCQQPRREPDQSRVASGPGG